MLNNLIVVGTGTHAENVMSMIPFFYPYTTLRQLSWEDVDNGLFSKETSYFVGIGDNKFRYAICDELIRRGAKLPNINFSNSAYVNDTGTFGNLFMPQSYISPLTTIGNFSIFNTGCIVEHHTQVGNSCHIAPGATICGSVKISDLCTIGANATVLPQSRIAFGLTVKANTLVK